MLLKDYENRHFINNDGTLDTTTNVNVITHLTTERYHLKLNGAVTHFGRNMIILPFDYLCAKSWKNGKLKVTSNTYTIHHFSGTWLSKPAQMKMFLRRNLFKFLPFC